MSFLDPNKPYNQHISEKNFSGYYVPNHNAKVIKESIKNGTAPFLPDQNGNIEAKPIFNGNTGYCLNAKDLIPLQIEKGNNSNVVVTFKTVNSSGTNIKKGEKGFFYNYEKNKETHEIGTSQFFFPEQTEKPELVLKTVEDKVKKNEHHLNKTIEINSSEPEEYLSSYIASCKSGAKLKVNPEIAKEFTEKFNLILDNQLSKSAERNNEIDKLHSLLLKVDMKANELNKKLYQENQQNKTQTKTQSQSNNKQRNLSMSH